MASRVERHTVRSPLRIGYVFATPVVLLAAVYLCVFLGLNSGRGSAFVADQISAALYGELSYRYLEVGPGLTRLDLYAAELDDHNGHRTITASHLGCTFSVPAFIAGRLEFRHCRGNDGSVLVYQDALGDVGIVSLFQGQYRPKRRRPNARPLVFDDVELTDFDVLVMLDDALIRFDDVTLTGGRVYAGRGPTEIAANAEFSGGRILLLDRIFNLGDGKGDWANTRFAITRHADPWRAAAMPAPPPPPWGRGAIDVPIDAGRIDGLRWYGDAFTVDRILLPGPEVSIDARGWLQLVPERPRVARRERGGILFDGHARVELPADSDLFDTLLPGIVRPARTPRTGPARIEPVVFEAYGNLRFFQGEPTRLSLRDLEILGWNLDSFTGVFALDRGRLTLAPGARLEMFGGVFTGSGEMIPREGTWSLDLCLDGIRLDTVAQPFVGGPQNVPDLLRTIVSTTPATCTADEGPGLRLYGDLTRKAFELAPAFDTPPDRQVQPSMLAGRVTDLRVELLDAPRWLPFDDARIDAEATLTQRGELVLLDDRGGPGLRVRGNGVDLLAGVTLDTVRGVLAPSFVDLRFDDLGGWLAKMGVPDTPDALDMRASFDVAGPLASPDIDGIRLTANNRTRFGVFRPFEATVRADIDGDDLLLTTADVSSLVGSVAAAGRMTVFDGAPWLLRDDPSFDLDLDIERLRLGRIVPDFGPAAELDTTLHLAGRASELTVSGDELVALDVVWLGEPIDLIELSGFSARPGREPRVDIERLFVSAGKGTIEGHAHYDAASGDTDVNLRGRTFALDEIRNLAELGLDLRGDARFDLDIDDDEAPWDVEGSLIVDDLEVSGFDIGDAALAFDTADGVVSGFGAVAGDLDLFVRLPLDGSAVTAVGRFRDAAVEHHWPAAAEVVDASSVSGEVRARVDDAGVTVDLTVFDATARIRDRVFEAPRPVRASFTDTGDQQRVAIHELTIGAGGHDITTRGTITLGVDPRISVSIGGDLDMSLLRFLPDLIVDADGVADVAIKVAGPLDDPELVGSADFGDSTIAPRGLGTAVALRPGSLVLTTDAILIDPTAPLRGVIWGGDFTASGEIGLRGLLPDSIDIDAFITGLAYRIPDELNTTLTADLHFVAGEIRDYDSWAVDGEVELLDVRYYRDFDLVTGQLAFGDFGRSVELFALPIWQQVEAIGRTSVDLGVTGRDRFLVESTIANVEFDVEFRTDLDVTGTFAAMNVQGEMEALEGSRVVYRGRTFEVREATLLFEGARDEYGYPLPRLDSELVATINPCTRRRRDAFDATDAATVGVEEIASVDITAWVDGLLPYDLNFRLESTPFYDQRDQLSLILTGCTVDELTAGSAGAPTLDLVLRPVVDLVERNVEERLDFDDVDLIPTTEGTAGIVIQDEVSERFSWTLDATVGAADDTRQIVRGAYKLFDWLVLELQEQTGREQTIRIDTGVRFRFSVD